MRQTYSGVLQDLFLRQEQTAQQQVAEALTRTQQADALRLKVQSSACLLFVYKPRQKCYRGPEI